MKLMKPSLFSLQILSILLVLTHLKYIAVISKLLVDSTFYSDINEAWLTLWTPRVSQIHCKTALMAQKTLSMSSGDTKWSFWIQKVIHHGYNRDI